MVYFLEIRQAQSGPEQARALSTIFIYSKLKKRRKDLLFENKNVL